MKTISIVTACYNEADNVEELYRRVRTEIAKAGQYRYEHIFIDNSSTDGTVAILTEIARRDHNARMKADGPRFPPIRAAIRPASRSRRDLDSVSVRGRGRTLARLGFGSTILLEG